MSLGNLCDLFFEFSNEDRLRILRTLQTDHLTVTALSNELELTTQETSRHLARLGEVGLTFKNPDGTHSLTGYGELSLKQITGFKFTTSHKGYFKNHDLSGLPAEFIARIGELENSRYIDDVMVIFHLIDQMIREAEEYVWRITDRYIITVIPAWSEALERGIEARLLEPENIVIPPEFNEGEIIADAVLHQQFLNHYLDNVPVFMSLSEKQVAGICFPANDGRIDYRGFVSEDPTVLKWAKDLYEHLWNMSTPKPID
jgi:predicted transcriptional regulator